MMPPEREVRLFEASVPYDKLSKRQALNYLAQLVRKKAGEPGNIAFLCDYPQDDLDPALHLITLQEQQVLNNALIIAVNNFPTNRNTPIQVDLFRNSHLIVDNVVERDMLVSVFAGTIDLTNPLQRTMLTANKIYAFATARGINDYLPLPQLIPPYSPNAFVTEKAVSTNTEPAPVKKTLKQSSLTETLRPGILKDLNKHAPSQAIRRLIYHLDDPAVVEWLQQRFPRDAQDMLSQLYDIVSVMTNPSSAPYTSGIDVNAAVEGTALLHRISEIAHGIGQDALQQQVEVDIRGRVTTVLTEIGSPTPDSFSIYHYPQFPTGVLTKLGGFLFDRPEGRELLTRALVWYEAWAAHHQENPAYQKVYAYCVEKTLAIRELLTEVPLDHK